MVKGKVGIITFHDSRNYGAVLQAYALQQKVSEEFRDVEIINYQNPEIAKVVKLWNYSGGGIKGLIKTFLAFMFRLRKKIAFDSFARRFLNLSSTVSDDNIADFSDRYDAVITGSDQVWNTVLTAGDIHYFLDFCNDKQFRIAYAASFGDSKIELSEDVKREISKFDHITLREEDMVNDVSECIGSTPEVCCDPALLLDAARWHSNCSKRLCHEKYVFLFMIDESDGIKKYAKRLADEKGLRLISNKNDFSFILHPSPSDFLSWIYNAEYVVTDSFHGTVFSILFHKSFISYIRNKEGLPKKRIIGLLEKVGLSHRNTDNRDLKVDEAEAWNSVDEKVENMRVASWNVMRDTFKDLEMS